MPQPLKVASRCEVACPAAAAEHGTLSLNRDDVRCRISGLIRDAEDAPCVDPLGYVECNIWRNEKHRLWIHRKPAVARKQINTGTGEWE